MTGITKLVRIAGTAVSAAVVCFPMLLQACPRTPLRVFCIAAFEYLARLRGRTIRPAGVPVTSPHFCWSVPARALQCRWVLRRTRCCGARLARRDKMRARSLLRLRAW